MISTPAQICNLALLRIGVKAQIDDLASNDSTEAQVANACYEHIRDTLLSDFHWPFATKRSKPAALSSTRSGWVYAYPLPGDCLTPQGVWSGDRNAPVDAKVPFTIELADDLGSQWFLTDQQSAEILYTARLTALPVMSTPFVDALGWALAREFILSLPVKLEYSERAEKRYQLALSVAKRHALTSRQVDRPPDAEHIRARL